MRRDTPDDPDAGCSTAITCVVFLAGVIIAFFFGIIFESGYCK